MPPGGPHIPQPLSLSQTQGTRPSDNLLRFSPCPAGGRKQNPSPSPTLPYKRGAGPCSSRAPGPLHWEACPQQLPHGPLTLAGCSGGTGAAAPGSLLRPGSGQLSPGTSTSPRSCVGPDPGPGLPRCPAVQGDLQHEGLLGHTGPRESQIVPELEPKRLPCIEGEGAVTRPGRAPPLSPLGQPALWAWIPR